MSEKISVVINEIKTEVEKGTTILDAATEVGIEIPTLCYLVGVSDVGMWESRFQPFVIWWGYPMSACADYAWWKWKDIMRFFPPAVRNA